SIQFKGNKGTAYENRDLRAKLCDAIVTMVQATDFWKSNDPADGLYRARFRRISLQREVKPRAVIIRKVRAQRTAQRLFTQDNHMVQTFTANRTDDAFDVSSLPRTSRSAEHFFDIHYRELVAELLAIDSISISQQISRCGIKRKGFEHLLRRPFRRRMSGDVEVHDASSIVCEDNKNEEDFEPNGVDGEKVDGAELRNVILEERPPRLGRGFGASDHVLGNRSLRDLNVQLHQLAV